MRGGEEGEGKKGREGGGCDVTMPTPSFLVRNYFPGGHLKLCSIISPAPRDGSAKGGWGWGEWCVQSAAA